MLQLQAMLLEFPVYALLYNEKNPLVALSDFAPKALTVD